jgi:hypothetical protein
MDGARTGVSVAKLAAIHGVLDERYEPRPLPVELPDSLAVHTAHASGSRSNSIRVSRTT